MLAKYEREEKQNLKKKKKLFRGSDSIQSNYAEFRGPKDEIQIQPVNFHLQNLISSNFNIGSSGKAKPVQENG